MSTYRTLYQATSKPDLMFCYADTPFPTLAECKRSADETFGPDNYTIERVRVREEETSR